MEAALAAEVREAADLPEAVSAPVDQAQISADSGPARPGISGTFGAIGFAIVSMTMISFSSAIRSFSATGSIPTGIIRTDTILTGITLLTATVMGTGTETVFTVSPVTTRRRL